MIKILYFSPDKTIRSVSPAELPDIWSSLSDPAAGTLWVDFIDTTEDEFALLSDLFKFHPLAIEECITPQERPKIDAFKDYLFLIIHSIFYYKENDPAEAISNRELDVFVGKNYVVTLHNGKIRAILALQEKLKSNPMPMEKGPDFLLYSIIELLIENYFYTLDKFEDHIDAVEDRIFTAKPEEIMSSIFALKKNVLFLRKVLSPQRELVAQLMRRDLPCISQGMMIYFRDISDDLVRIHELLESFREFITSLMESYLTILSNRLNETMKTLTIIATFMMPLTFITGFYGMNIKIPEFGWGMHGYYFVWAIILAVTAVMFYVFKKKKVL